MLRSEFRSEGRVFSGCFALFQARKNDGMMTQKTTFEKQSRVKIEEKKSLEKVKITKIKFCCIVHVNFIFGPEIVFQW